MTPERTTTEIGRDIGDPDHRHDPEQEPWPQLPQMSQGKRRRNHDDQTDDRANTDRRQGPLAPQPERHTQHPEQGTDEIERHQHRRSRHVAGPQTGKRPGDQAEASGEQRKHDTQRRRKTGECAPFPGGSATDKRAEH
ncbi:hypothetical protein SDC9_144794 [bioreactor metagenome]|uniref:Uncharacterized protein n=1 Tax=bioreactor metagenome TaxID=1076179 RepID=A0A645E878_9ZZZZ